MTPHFNQNTLLSTSVSYNVYTSDLQEWLKVTYLAETIKKWLIFISWEPLILWTWLAPHFDQNNHISTSVSYNAYQKYQQEWLKLTDWARNNKNGWFSYLNNQSYELGRSPILIRITIFLSVSRIMCTKNIIRND